MLADFVVRDVSAEGFSTTSVVAAQRAETKLKGCLDMHTSPLLKNFLAQLMPPIKAGLVTGIDFDVQELYLMSSSAIGCFASWVKDLKELRATCRVKFRTNPNLTWQRRTLGPIRSFAEQIVLFE